MCDFPSWIQTDDGEVIFLADSDVQALIDDGKIASFEDGVGHSAIEMTTDKRGVHFELGHPIPYEVMTAVRSGSMSRMAKAAGYTGVVWSGRHSVTGGKVLALDHACVDASGSAKVTAYDSAKVTAYDSAEVYASGSAEVTAYDSAEVTAYDSAEVTRI